MTYHSNKNFFVENFRKNLMFITIELLNCTATIALHTERMSLYKDSNKKKEIKLYLESKVMVENMTLYQKRITDIYNEIINQLNIISARYNGKYDKIFSLYFFQGLPFDEVCEKVKKDFSPKQVRKIIERLEEDFA